MRTLTLALALAGCADTTRPADLNPGEVITAVRLRFTPSDGGAVVEAAWSDPEADGDPVIDPIVLDDAVDYTLAVAFVDELSQPDQDLTTEIEAEAEQHQVFVTGTAVSGPATGDNPDAVVGQAYGDTDADGLPVGLVHAIGTLAPGSGTFEVTLRHLPVEGGVPLKTASLAEDAATGGIGSLPGDTDAAVSFDLTVP